MMFDVLFSTREYLKETELTLARSATMHFENSKDVTERRKEVVIARVDEQMEVFTLEN